MKLKKYFSVFLSAAVTAASAAGINIYSEPEANPVISRNCPAYSDFSPSTAASANDEFYYTSWSGIASDYLAYDLSSVLETQRKKSLPYDTIEIS